MLRSRIAALLIAASSFASPALGGGIPPPSDAGPGGGAGDALSNLIANARCHDCWFKINGNDLISVLNAYGWTKANYNGAADDAFANDSGAAVAAQSGGGFAAPNNASVVSYTAATIRQSDGKSCYIGSGGHEASGVSAAICLDLIAAAATCNLSTFLCNGQWRMAAKPGRVIRGWNAKPAGATQPNVFTCKASWSAQSAPATLTVSGCTAGLQNWEYLQNGATACLDANAKVNGGRLNGGSGTITISGAATCGGSNVLLTFNPYLWYMTNESPIGAGNGDQMPVPCHQYYSGIAFPGTTKWSVGGGGCGVIGGEAPHGVFLFDDATGRMTFPLLSGPRWISGYAQVGNHTSFTGLSYNDLDGCLYVQPDDQLKKICNPLSPSATLTYVASATDSYNIYESFVQSLIFPDPNNPLAQRAMIHFRDNGNFNNCRGNQTYGCFGLWWGIGGTIHDVVGAWNSALPSGFDSMADAMCWDATANKILVSKGGKAIYSVNITGAPTASPGTSGWGMSQWNGTAAGVTPAAAQESGQASLQCLQPTYQAEVLAVQQNVYLHID